MGQSRRGFLGWVSLLPWVRRRRSTGESLESTVELDRFFVAGFRHHGGTALLPRLSVGDELRLLPEVDNPHDDGAIAIYAHERCIGYVPRDRNETIGRLMYQCVAATCRIVALRREADPWEAVEVCVTIPCRTERS
jgi:hypothetical protein